LKTLAAGTIIRGTTRDADVIPALLDALATVDRSRADEIRLANLDVLSDMFADDGDKEAVSDLRAKLFDVLQEYAPAGHIVGSHEGDASDYGVWDVRDESEESE
jgi:hypothetical protein